MTEMKHGDMLPNSSGVAPMLCTRCPDNGPVRGGDLQGPLTAVASRSRTPNGLHAQDIVAGIGGHAAVR